MRPHTLHVTFFYFCFVFFASLQMHVRRTFRYSVSFVCPVSWCICMSACLFVYFVGRSFSLCRTFQVCLGVFFFCFCFFVYLFVLYVVAPVVAVIAMLTLSASACSENLHSQKLFREFLKF